MNVYSDVASIKGVGPKIKELLNKCGIFSVIDLLLYFPREYENISFTKNVSTEKDGDKIIVKCRFMRNAEGFRSKTGKIITKLMFTDDKSIFYGVWFNMPFVAKKFIPNKEYVLMGKIKILNGEIAINSPVTIDEKNNDRNKIVPIYPLKENLKNSYLMKTIDCVLSQIEIEENLPSWVLKKHNFLSLDKAIRFIHSPKNKEQLEEARKRLKFQELFTYSLKIFMLKSFINDNKSGIAFKISKELVEIKESLPYKLTQAQNKVIREILIDEKKATSMNRLVQGDVGCGKTIVALIAMFNVIKNGYQGAFLAPTEILANQHYEEARKLYKEFNINIELLTGSLRQRKKN